MRRLMTVLPLSLLLLLAAVPAFAAEEEFSGTFAGLGYAVGAGILLGIVYFAVLHRGPSEADEYEDHH